MVWPAIIAGAALLGKTLLENRAENKAQEANMEMAAENRDLQREFAQYGIRWKAADAKAAGLHPLAALGAQTTSYQPQSVFNQADSSWATGLGEMGQNISRAYAAQATEGEKELARLKIAQEEEKLRNMRLENIRLGRDLYDFGSTPSFPARGDRTSADMFLPGQGNTSGNQNETAPYVVTPNRITSHDEVVPGRTAGINAADDLYMDAYGRGLNVINQNAGDAMDADTVAKWKLNLRRIKDWYDGITSGTKSDVRQKLYATRPEAPAGQIWLYNRWMAEWELHDSYEGDSRLYAPGSDYRQFYDMPGRAR